MKFRFKIQQYQTDAVDSVVRAFKGQPYSDGVSYRRDLGEVKPVFAPVDQQISLFPPDQISMDEVDDTGYLNEMLQLTDEQLLKNIRDVQQDRTTRFISPLPLRRGWDAVRWMWKWKPERAKPMCISKRCSS